MKKLIILHVSVLLFTVLSVSAMAQKPGDAREPAFDKQLAEKLGADDYGMGSYVLAVLKTGPADADIKDADARKKIFEGHFANMDRLAKKGKLVLAGPFIKGGEKRGLFIFDVATLEEAKKLVESDPAVKAGVFVFELTRWYGSAAVRQINEIHQSIQKKKM